MPPVSSRPGIVTEPALPLPGQPVVEPGHRNQHAHGDDRPWYRVTKANQAIQAAGQIRLGEAGAISQQQGKQNPDGRRHASQHEAVAGEQQETFTELGIAFGAAPS